MKIKSLVFIILLIAAIGLSGCVQSNPISSSVAPKADASFSIEDITDTHSSYLNEPSGFYDAYCTRGCSSGDTRIREMVYGYDDVAGTEMQRVALYFFTPSKIDSFNLITTTGAPDNYIIKEKPTVLYNIGSVHDRSKYVYEVKIEYLPKLKFRATEMFLLVDGFVDDRNVPAPFTIQIRKDPNATKGFDYFKK